MEDLRFFLEDSQLRLKLIQNIFGTYSTKESSTVYSQKILMSSGIIFAGHRWL